MLTVFLRLWLKDGLRKQRLEKGASEVREMVDTGVLPWEFLFEWKKMAGPKKAFWRQKSAAEDKNNAKDKSAEEK